MKDMKWHRKKRRLKYKSNREREEKQKRIEKESVRAGDINSLECCFRKYKNYVYKYSE